jgi:hypothetical protein
VRIEIPTLDGVLQKIDGDFVNHQENADKKYSAHEFAVWQYDGRGK